MSKPRLGQYDRRSKEGRVALMAWISKEASERLTHCAQEAGMTKTALLEHLIDIALFGASAEPKSGGLLDATARHIMNEERADEDDEPIPEPRRNLRPHAVHVTPAGSPAALAQRVMENGRRRDAVVVATGEHALEGRVRRRP